MVTSPTELGPENDWDGEGQKQLQTIDPSSRQRERPTSTNPQLSDSNKNLVVSPRRVFIPRQTGRLTVGRNIRLRLRLGLRLRLSMTAFVRQAPLKAIVLESYRSHLVRQSSFVQVSHSGREGAGGPGRNRASLRQSPIVTCHK
jgi:ABC-type phosphonate transport system ATPase subunit